MRQGSRKTFSQRQTLLLTNLIPCDIRKSCATLLYNFDRFATLNGFSPYFYFPGRIICVIKSVPPTAPFSIPHEPPAPIQLTTSSETSRHFTTYLLTVAQLTMSSQSLYSSIQAILNKLLEPNDFNTLTWMAMGAVLLLMIQSILPSGLSNLVPLFYLVLSCSSLP